MALRQCSAIFRLARLAITALPLLAKLCYAQGGPPFLSDDPDTPGNRNWEINVGAIGERNAFSGSYEVPNIDLNYGLGHRIQLKFELPLSVTEERGDAGHVAAGLGNSLVGVKWRFFARHPKSEPGSAAGERDSTFGFSIYPQLELNNPTRSVARGIAEPGPQFLLPLEGSAKFGPISISAEVGYWFTSNDVPRSWIRGVVIGHEFKKDTEVYLELYDRQETGGTAERPAERSSTIGIGGRVPIVKSGSVRLMGMAGHGLVTATPTNGQPGWIAYVGIQFLTSGGRRRSSDFMQAAGQ